MPWGWGGGGAVATAPLNDDEIRNVNAQQCPAQQELQQRRGYPQQHQQQREEQQAAQQRRGSQQQQRQQQQRQQQQRQQQQRQPQQRQQQQRQQQQRHQQRQQQWGSQQHPMGPNSAATGPPVPQNAYNTGNVAVAYCGAFPDYVKLIKSIRVAPLVFTATAAVNPRTLERFITFSTRETLFNGAFHCHVSRKSLEYRHILPLPIGSVVLAAEWRLGQPVHKPRLTLALGGDASAALTQPGALPWRKAVFPWRRMRGAKIGIEAAADVSASMQLDLSGQTSSGFKLNFDIKELDLVCRI